MNEEKTFNPLVRFTNKIRTSLCLDLTEGVFSDFNRRKFDKTAILFYDRLADAFDKNNKTTLMSLLSFPLQQAFNASQKEDGLMMPFKFYDQVISAKLRQGNAK